MQKRVEEHLGGDDLLAHRGAVVDANARPGHVSPREPAAVVAVGLALEAAAVVRVRLGAIGHHQRARHQPGELVEGVDEHLTETLALARIVAAAEDPHHEAAGHGVGVDGGTGALLTEPVGGVGAAGEHLLGQSTTAPSPCRRAGGTLRRPPWPNWQRRPA
ncbi:MAG: hypothetical protein ACYDAC_05600 [Candidatus Dormibacteria bacterium]